MVFPCMEPPIDSQPQALGPPPGLEEVLGSAHLQQHLAAAQARPRAAVVAFQVGGSFTMAKWGLTRPGKRSHNYGKT